MSVWWARCESQRRLLNPRIAFQMRKLRPRAVKGLARGTLSQISALHLPGAPEVQPRAGTGPRVDLSARGAEPSSVGGGVTRKPAGSEDIAAGVENAESKTREGNRKQQQGAKSAARLRTKGTCARAADFPDARGEPPANPNRPSPGGAAGAPPPLAAARGGPGGNSTAQAATRAAPSARAAQQLAPSFQSTLRMVKIEARGRPGPSVRSAATGACEPTCVHVPGASCPGRRGGGRAECPLRPEGTGAAVCSPAARPRVGRAAARALAGAAAVSGAQPPALRVWVESLARAAGL